MKHYVRQSDLVYLGQHGKAPKDSLEIPAILAGKAVKMENGSVVLDDAAQSQLEAQETQAQADAVEEAKVQKYISRGVFASRVKAEIAKMNDEKGWSAAEVIAYLSDPVIQQIDGLITGISFGSALSLIQSSDLSSYYTPSEIAKIELLLSNYIASE